MIHLISKDVCDAAAVKAVKTAEHVGEEAKKSFMDMLQNNPSSFNNSITLNRLRVFHKSQTRGKQNAQGREMKDQLQHSHNSMWQLKLEMEIWMNSSNMKH